MSCVRLLTAACLICYPGADGWAQNYPVKSIRFIVGGSAGSGGDVLGRIVAAGLAQSFGQQVVVDNRPGASGKIGAEIAAKAPPDGYTLFLIQIAHALYAATARKPTYDAVRDFAPVTQFVQSPNVLVVHPSMLVHSVGDLIKLAKARPGAINCASAGLGSSTYIAAELFKGLTGINMVDVPYNGGGPPVTAIVAGEVSVYFAPFATVLPFVRQGRLRALAATTAQRIPVLPELPTIAEAGVAGYEYSNWYGVAVPAKTPQETIIVLRNAIVAVLNRPEVIKSMSDLGGIPVASQPEEFAAYIKAQITMLQKHFANKVIAD
jgi:tripartite-type tricarboxylate transporter receptor subunit TctC